MNFKKFARLSAYSLMAGLAFFAQKASCLPFWDAATNYGTVPPGGFINLGGNDTLNGPYNPIGLINPEGNPWCRVFTNTSPDVQIVNYPLSYPGLECSASNAFLFGFTGGNTGFSERIAINPPMLAGPTFTGVNSGYTISNAYLMNSGTIYYSFIFQVQNLGTLGTGAGFICGFNTAVGPQGGTISFASARLYFKIPSTGSTNYQVGIGANTSAGSAATFLTNLYTTNSTNFVVCSYTFVTGNGGSNNIAQMWLNPDPSTFGTALPPGTDAANYDNGGYASNNNNSGGVGSGALTNEVMSFYWRQGNSAIPLVYAADLRIADCWGCVAPPAVNPAPQPAALSIAAASTNQNVISFQTNTPCYLMQTSTNLVYTTNTWPLVTTPPAVVGANFVVTNSVASVSVVISNVVDNVTNFTTNTFLPPTYYQVKTYAN